MRLPFLKQTINKKDFYFALLLGENSGIGSILMSEGVAGKEKTKVINHSLFSYSSGWNELTKDVDNVLFTLEKEPHCHIREVILFLHGEHFDSTRQIKKNIIVKLKQLLKDLDLKPIGYVESHEVISSYYQEHERSRLTGIIVEININVFYVYIYKSGLLVEMKIFPKTDLLTEDIKNAFHVIKQNTILPPRIILYDSSHVFEESSRISSYDWDSSLFIQPPRIEIFTDKKMIEGFGIIFKTYQKKEIVDVLPNSKATEHPHEQENGNIMGFVIGKDITQQKQTPHKQSISYGAAAKQRVKQTLPVLLFKEKCFHFFTVLKPIMKSPFINVVLLFIMPVLLMTFIILLFFHSAKLFLIYPSQVVKKNVEFTSSLIPNKSDDLKLEIGTLSAKLQDTRETTGKKDVGETAKGQVTVYNFDEKEKILSKGTIFQSGDLQFTSDEEVKLPPSTLSPDAEAKLPGKQKTAATASRIGPEYNIDKDKRLTVSNYSSNDVFAIVLEPFKGGSKKTIRTVSKKDIEDAKTLMLKEAQNRADKELMKKNDAKTIVVGLTEFKLSNLSLSKELGEEGDKITISAQGITTYRFISDTEMRKTISKTIKPILSDSFILSEKSISYSSIEAKLNKTNVRLSSTIQAKAYKQISNQAIQNKLVFVLKKNVSPLLDKEYKIQVKDININPDIYPFNTMLPLFINKITLIPQD